MDVSRFTLNPCILDWVRDMVEFTLLVSDCVMPMFTPLNTLSADRREYVLRTTDSLYISPGVMVLSHLRTLFLIFSVFG